MKSDQDTLGPIGFLKQAVGMMRPYGVRLIFFMGAVVFQVVFYFSLPLFYREIFDRVIPNRDLDYLTQLILLLVGLFVLQSFAEWLDGRLIARMAVDVMRDLRLRMYEHLQKLSLGFFMRTSTGDLLSRFTSDLAMVEQALAVSFYRVVFHSFAIVAATGLLFVFEWRLALMTLLAFPLGFIGPKLLGPAASRAGSGRKEVDA